jgi:formylglycine-generating enzyme required for sulfatase activity
MILETLLSAAISTGLGLLAKVGFEDEIVDLKNRLSKTDEKKREAAFNQAYQQARKDAKEDHIVELLDHKPFQEEVVKSLLDPAGGFDFQAVARHWMEKYPESAPALRKFFIALQHYLTLDDTWGPILERYQALRSRPDITQALVERQLPATDRQLVPVVNAILQGSGAVALGEGAQAAFIQGDYYQVGQIIIQKIVFGDEAEFAEKEESTEALAIYRRIVAESTSSLPLRGVDIGASDPTSGQARLGLVNIYIDLDTTSRTYVVVKKPKEGKAIEVFPSEGESAQPLPALVATIANRRLALLGDPGGGKSTFVNFLAQCLARHTLQPEDNWLEHLPEWPESEQDVLPVMVLLRDFARGLPENLPGQASPRHLWDFIVARLEAQNLALAAGPIGKLLEQGKALLLLDGLDEVPTREQRVFVRDALQAFIDRYPDNRYLVTCRILSYQPPRAAKEPDLRLADLPAFQLAPFDEPKIDRFITGWYEELARLGMVTAEAGPELTGKLKEAVRRADLWRLAPNPLLLTVMALVHTHKGRLPEARALLYEETVDILLWRWEQMKLTRADDAPQLRQLLLEAGRGDVDLKRSLWELAYEAHSQTKPEEGAEGLADISQYRLQSALATLNNDDHTWARQVVETMKVRAGLLLERAPEVFTFPHRTFQEYLAGAYLAAQGDFAARCTDLSRQGDLWREAILLGAGKLVHHSGELDKPLALVGELCPARPPEDDSAWRQAWLAGDVLLEIGLARVGDSALGCDLLERVQGRLVALLSQGKLTIGERARAGDTLGRLGDPRFDPAHWHLPAEPLLGFVHISAGEFRMGSDPRRDEEADDIEKRQHEVKLPDYFIARYPVTVAQFRAFSEARQKPPQDMDSLGGLPNHPVVFVTWREAQEYCGWLGEQLRGLALGRVASGLEGMDATQQDFWQGLVQGRLAVSLPSEAEWEKAARGESGWIYPWGDEFDAEKANTDETGLGRTLAVGCFPGGASSYGVLDLSGNVWEWTRSLYEPYPYNPRDGRENPNASGPRVLRGGSFLNFRGFARCAFRFSNYPGYLDGVFGFRVVVSLSNSGL